MSTPPPGQLREPPTTPPNAPNAERLGWLGLLRDSGFRRLLAVRFAAQWGDGMFQVALAAWLTLAAVLGAAFLLGGAGQVVKLCADAGVQGEVGDEARGRVFALYDAVFNICYVLAIAVAALLAPPTGVAPWLVAAAAGVYLLGLLAHDRVLRRAS